jgi:hypothetical protein
LKSTIGAERAARVILAQGVFYGCLGALILSLPAQHWRIDRAAPAELGHAGDWLYALAFALALALFANAWRVVAKARPSLPAALACGALVHAVALACPPFLSLDPLCYAAIGRALARFGGDAYRPLSESLPAGDPYLRALPALWRSQGSAYCVGFNELTRLLALFGGSDRALFLKLLQLLGFAAMGSAAWLTALAVGVRRPEARGRAAALVLFCPLSILEGTVSAHNDALLALGVAAFALAVEQRRRGASVVALVAAVTIKASGLLLLIVRVTQLVMQHAGARVRLRAYLVPFASGLLLAAAALVIVMRHYVSLRLPLALIGLPEDAPHCTRSIECVPRALLFWGAKNARVAWAIGLCFRVTGIGWLAYVGWRCARSPQRALAWSATGLFVYYLCLHGYFQSWYLLPLIPLLPFADDRLRPAMRLFCVTAVAYYVIRLPLQSDTRLSIVALREVLEGLVVIVPPAIALAFGLSRARSGHSSQPLEAPQKTRALA